MSPTLANVVLTQDQQKANNAFLDFLVSDENFFVIQGAAGTGKSFLIKHLLETFYAKYKAYCLLLQKGRGLGLINNPKKIGFSGGFCPKLSCITMVKVGRVGAAVSFSAPWSLRAVSTARARRASFFPLAISARFSIASRSESPL